MGSDVRDRLLAEKTAAEAELGRLRKEQSALNEAKREGAEVSRAEITKIQGLVGEARVKLEKATAAARAFEKTGEEHAIVIEADGAFGTLAVRVPPGTSHEGRATIIEEALVGPLESAATQFGVVLAAEPLRFSRERPGRDAEGRTILDVGGRVEGDKLVPAVSRASRNLRP